MAAVAKSVGLRLLVNKRDQESSSTYREKLCQRTVYLGFRGLSTQYYAFGQERVQSACAVQDRELRARHVVKRKEPNHMRHVDSCELTERFEHSNFENQDLFRISCFVFRILPPPLR